MRGKPFGPGGSRVVGFVLKNLTRPATTSSVRETSAQTTHVVEAMSDERWDGESNMEN